MQASLIGQVTILPRTNGAGGFTLFTPTEERLESGLYSMRYLKGQLAVALGGREAPQAALQRKCICPATQRPSMARDVFVDVAAHPS